MTFGDINTLFEKQIQQPTHKNNTNDNPQLLMADDDDNSSISSTSMEWTSDDDMLESLNESLEEINDEPWMGGRNWFWSLNPELQEERENRQRTARLHDNSLQNNNKSDSKSINTCPLLQDKNKNDGETNGITDYITGHSRTLHASP